MNTHGCPDIIIGSLDRYVNHRIPCGDFLTAVLENNLFEALGRADHINRILLFEITCYIYNELPHDYWGSKDAVTKWLKGRKR